MAEVNTEQIKSELQKEVKSAKSKQTLTEIKLKYLGKSGIINKLAAQIKDIPNEERATFGQKLNALKTVIEEALVEASKEFSGKKKSNVNISTPIKANYLPTLHPTTLVIRDLTNFFKYYGFSVLEGPEIEDDFHNFEMMGVPKDHPARELQDTLYIKEPELLLRTHTSNVEARILEAKELPVRVVTPGKVFRNETTNKSNGAVFYQFQGVYVDTNVTMGHLKWMFEKALKYILGDDTIIRFRSKYYPEVEPGLSPDIQCKFCSGKGCDVCKQRGWIEIAGGGMIHPSTFEKAGIDNKKYSGFAFGWGLDRVVMTKYKIPDQRMLYSGSLIYK
jgi:phenylalanyl-tRNA synthetase alpha chain